MLNHLEGGSGDKFLTAPDELLAEIDALLERTCPTVEAASQPPEVGTRRESVPSDWHMEPGVAVYLRRDGLLKPELEIPAWRTNWSEPTAKWLKDLAAGPKCADIEHEWGGWRFRVHIQVSHRGIRPLAAVMLRRLPQTLPPALRLPKEFIEACKSPRGVAIISGGTGSGKSTTLALLVSKYLPQEGLHIVTYENPIEFRHTSGTNLIRQYALGADFNTFGEALGEQALRADPEIIIPAELREPEAIRSALDAADTGHFVVGALHLSTAPTVVSRILNAAGQSYADKLAQSLTIVLCQTLVPVKGGGRVAVFEQLVVTPAVRSILALVESRGSAEVAKTLDAEVASNGVRHGSFTIEHSLAVLIDQGRITMEAALGYAARPDVLRTRYNDLLSQARICSADLGQLYSSKTSKTAS